MRWIVHIAINTLIFMVVAGYYDAFYLKSIGAALIASIILSILNVIVKPLLIVLTLPVTVLTLGLFLVVINAITLTMTAAIMGDSFQIAGFGSAIIASIFISILNILLDKFIMEPMKKRS